MTNRPTPDQIRAYLATTGWSIGPIGAGAAIWQRWGGSIRLPHTMNDWDLDQAVFQIALAEDRHPGDVHQELLAFDGPAVGGPVLEGRRLDESGRMPAVGFDGTMPTLRSRQLDYLQAVLGIFHRADNYQSLMWRPTDAGIRFAAMCSDTFVWGTADAERIEPEDIPLLEQCLADLRVADPQLGECDLPELFAARKRGMRPMRLFLWPKHGRQDEGWPAVRELFLAAGPERDPASEG